MVAFVEERLNTEYRYGQSGGPEFNTSVVITSSGQEYRNANWSEARGKWKMADDMYSRAELAALIAFFRARQGQAQGFRFRDWTDFRVYSAVGNEQGVMQLVSGNTYQLYKKYTTVGLISGSTFLRKITKPIPAGSVLPNGGTYAGVDLYKNGVKLTYGAGAGQVAFDETTGLVVFVTDPTGSTLTWQGEFDVPVRFSSDSFTSDFAAYRESDGEALFSVTGCDIIELMGT